jgi:hypothetical protein
MVAVLALLAIVLGAKTTADYIFYSAFFAIILVLIPAIYIPTYKKKLKKQFSSGTIDVEGFVLEYTFNENGFVVTEFNQAGEQLSVEKSKWVEVSGIVEHKGCLYISVNNAAPHIVDGGGMIDCQFSALIALVKSAIAPQKYKVRKLF